MQANLLFSDLIHNLVFSEYLGI